MKIIPKSNIQEARVRWREMHDHPFIDLRVFYLADHGAMVSILKGVTFNIDTTLELARAIEVVARWEKPDAD